MEGINTVQIIPVNLLSRVNTDSSGICYSMKLANIVKRRAPETNAGKFSGLMSGLGNAINDTISSAMQDTYVMRTLTDEVWVLSDKMMPMKFNLADIIKDIEIGTEIKASIKFPSGEIDSGTIKLSPDSVLVNFSGNIKQMLADFGNVLFDNMTNYFMMEIISKRTTGEEPYKFKKEKSINTLVVYDESGITLLNDHKRIEFDSVLAYNSSEGYCEILTRENDEFVLLELFETIDSKMTDAEMNLIRTSAGGNELSISFPEKVIKANEYLAAFEINGLAMVAVDNKLYSLVDNTLVECGVFKDDSDVYVKTVNGKTKKYDGCENITETLSKLPFGYDSIFTNCDVPQPFIYNGEIVDFMVSDTGIKAEANEFEYAKMQDCSYKSTDFSCTIDFSYDSQRIEITTASSLGIYVCNLQEKVFVKALTQNYNINQLYDCFYKRCTQNFLASTFSEIFKTNKLLDVDIAVDELINVLRADDSAVLRSAFQSMIGKFKNVEDVQSDLLQKITLLEIQRKKIQKMFDEWLLYYPHYMATVQVKWLKYIFAGAISNEALNTEYWKCVAHFKRILSSGNAYVQKNMNEIGTCVNKISAALPEEVKRTDITTDLRVTSNSEKSMLKAGTDIMVGVTAGMELANILVRGFTASNPLAISMSAKMLVDSYTKDVEMRKNVKAFGLQSLEWWKIFMNGIRIHIIELSNGVTEYNKLCLKRDTEIFKKLPDESKEQIKNKLLFTLKDKIIESIDDKFMEILPQFNMRISNVIKEIDSNTEFLNVSLDEFKNNLFI